MNAKKIIITAIILTIIVNSCSGGDNTNLAKQEIAPFDKTRIEHVDSEIMNKNNLPSFTESTSEEVKKVSEEKVSIQDVLSEGGAEIQFENSVWDFGEINQKESVNYVYEFINTGSEPLIISNAKGSCGCTVPEWPKEPIPSNGIGEIAIQFNSGEKKGRQNKTVTLTTNCTPNTTILRVVGNILVLE